MASTYPRGKKLWIRFKNAAGEWDGAPTEFALGEESAAQAWADDVQRRIDRGEELGEALGPLTVKRYADAWIKSRRARGVGSVDDDETRLKLHALPTIGTLRLGEVRPRHVRELVRKLEQEGKVTRKGKGGKEEKRGGLAPRSI